MRKSLEFLGPFTHLLYSFSTGTPYIIKKCYLMSSFDELHEVISHHLTIEHKLWNIDVRCWK